MKCWIWIVMLLSGAAQAGCERPWRVGYDDWPPYHYRNQEQVLTGFAVQVLEAVAKRMDCYVVFRERPWKRTLQGVASGDLDIAMEATQSEARSRYAYFSDPYSPGLILLWVREGEQDGATSLREWLEQGKRLGTTREFDYGDPVMQLLAEHAKQVTPLVEEERNYGKLQLQRIDGFLGDAFATRWKLEQENLLADIVPHQARVIAMPTRFMLSKRRFDPAFVAQFNQALAAFQADREYDALLRRYAPVGVRP
ncbi:substrate-binding periplasmic protein [Aeromonas simiae]|uniref:substrate-binding periplasmic protein n=1 Tax=Aeromonas simiae TaxID=218936 RepID=UPI001E361617|nr:transporter substrate-binding domain-containing protein [Aeromonas simiae]MDO2947533.1 transporter substrate-binding domain-containing protein [Aeromonas simiae]MDO2951624.1 transporter substrate-binding domain-containing protein [Aeromonas simiae]MDO2955093.1 transporter substrate-binding domain-containing protein [Aeromonas simiae]